MVALHSVTARTPKARLKLSSVLVDRELDSPETPRVPWADKRSANCTYNNMAGDGHKADVHGILDRHHARYEVHPYYVVLERRPPKSPPVDQRIQAGFDVDLFGTLDKMELPRFHSEDGHTVVRYFEAVGREVESKVGQQCTIEVIPYVDSLVLDTHEHFQPEVMLRIRISHGRGLDQPEGPPEEKALNAIRETLHELEVRQA